MKSAYKIRQFQEIDRKQLELIGLPANYIAQYTNSAPLYRALKCFGILTSYLYLMTEQECAKVLGTILLRKRLRLIGRGYQWRIHAVYVAPELRGKGFGVELVQYALRRLSERRVKEVSLKVDEDNEPAIGLYRKCGFAEIERRKRQLVLARHLTV